MQLISLTSGSTTYPKQECLRPCPKPGGCTFLANLGSLFIVPLAQTLLGERQQPGWRESSLSEELSSQNSDVGFGSIETCGALCGIHEEPEVLKTWTDSWWRCKLRCCPIRWRTFVFPSYSFSPTCGKTCFRDLLQLCPRIWDEACLKCYIYSICPEE